MADFKDTSFGKKAAAFGKNKLGIDAGFGELEKLKFFDDNGAQKYETVLNPTEVSHQFTLTYTEPVPAAGAATTESQSKVASCGPESLKFELMMDGTGVTGNVIDVAWEIKELSQAIYHEIHSKEDKQNKIQITWGHTINFKGNLESFGVAYSLFDPKGNPLRAKVSLSFVGTSDLTSITQVQRKSNTQVVDLKEGTTLTNICKSVYNSPLTYIAVAKANKLTNVRKLKPGTKLTMPPKKA
jgi:nucleoid-associated protein YgaU